MKRLLLLALAVAGIACVLSACSPQPAPKSPASHDLDALFEVDDLVIVANDGSRHAFDVYIAIDHEQQRRGLMFVRDLPQRTGMLFVYDEAAVHSMWMKNTYISLDMVFARADGTVSSVIQDTEPLSQRSLSSIEPVSFVLELNAGVTRRLGIGPGSRLIWEQKPD